MITPGDTARLLAKISAYDQRTVGAADIAAWYEALSLADPPIAVDDAMAAVTHWHATAEEGRMRPVHVIQGAHAIASRRAGRLIAIHSSSGCRGLPAAQASPYPPLAPAPGATSSAARDHCRRVIAQAVDHFAIPEPDRPETRSERVYRLALERARRERAGRHRAA